MRSWRRARGIGLLAVIAFAVGIGSTTAIFAVINGMLLRPLPYPEGNRFVTLWAARVNDPARLTMHRFREAIEYERRTASFDVFGWFRVNDVNLTSPGEPQSINAVAVTPSLAHNLGVNPVLGRWFTDETGVVISNQLWKRLGGEQTIVGTPVTIDGRRVTITGVMPSSFRLPISGAFPFPVRPQIWTYLDPAGRGQNPNDQIYLSYARRKPGISFAQAEADVKRVAALIAAADPVAYPAYTARLMDLRESPFVRVPSTIIVLFGAAGLLLLIACANVATLILSRSVARMRETAIRVALGAARRHLAVGYFVEGLFVSIAGAALGVLLSIVLVRLIVVGGAAFIRDVDDIGIDWRVLAVASALACLASALASLAPLWQAIRTAPNAILADGVRASSSRRARRLSQALVVGEIALAFMLLAAGTILVAHLDRLNRVSPGFSLDGLLTFDVAVPAAVFRTPGRAPYQKRMVEALAQIPGVTSVAFANQLPLKGGSLGGTIVPEGGVPTRDARRARFMLVTPEYAATMGIPVRAGRFLIASDRNENFAFAAINETAARRYWPNQNPVGRYGRLNDADGNRFQVVGVVADVRNETLNKPPGAEAYLLAALYPVSPMNFAVRSPLPTARLIQEVRRTVANVDPTVVIRNSRTMVDVVAESLQLERVSSWVMTFFALAALLMAALGIYGVVSYSVRQRTVEMGTRMAVGAVARDLLRLVVGGAVKMATLGIAAGGVAVVGAVWLLVRFLDIQQVGAMPFVFSTLTVVAVSIAASYAPAWRASRLSPMVAIRDEPSSAFRSARSKIRGVIRDARQAADAPAFSSTALLTDFVAAARHAESFADALRVALATMCAQLRVERATLTERSADEFRCKVTVGPAEASRTGLPARGFLANRLEAYPHPIGFTPADYDALEQWARAHKPGCVDELRWLRDLDVRLAVPLRTRTEMLGVLLLGPPAGRDSFSMSEKETLSACADQFVLMIENARLTERVVEQEKLRQDLALAVEVQKGLLPAEAPQSPAAAFAGVSLPARSIGGDYYDFIRVGDRQIGIALADVSGKGIAAALIMAAVQASLRIIASDGDISLPRLAAKMNRFLYRSTPENKYATFFYAQVDAESRQLRYVNAGHNPPYLVRAGRDGAGAAGPEIEIQELSAGGAVVGMFPELSYDEATVDLRAGDLLVAFTDGVTEAQNPDTEEFGEERLKDLLRRVAALPVPDVSRHLSTELKQWIGDAPQYDDLTFVLMKVT